MGFADDVAKRISAAFSRDKDQANIQLAKGATGELGGGDATAIDLMSGVGYDALTDYLRLDTDLLLRFADYEEMDDYGEIACLTGNSEIGVLGDGPYGVDYVTVTDLIAARAADPSKKLFTLAVDLEGRRVVPVEMRGPVLSGKQSPVFKVTFEEYRSQPNEPKRQWSVRATANHPFMLRDGTYRTVAQLTPGTRLMAAGFAKTAGGYAQVRDLFNTRSGKSQYDYLHRMVCREILNEGNAIGNDDVVHHLDENKLNNDPSNLQIVRRADHARDHAPTQTPAVRAKLSKVAKARWADPLEAARWSAGQRRTKAEDLAVSRSTNTTPKGALSEAHRQAIAAGRTLPLAKDIVETALRTSTSISAAARSLKISDSTLMRRVLHYGLSTQLIGTSLQSIHLGEEAYSNHVIVSVEPDGFDDVFDIEVPKYRNFLVAGGVFVHNTALDILADDATQPDSVLHRTIWITSPDKTLQSNLDDLFNRTLRMDEEIWEIARTLCISAGERVWLNGKAVPIEAVSLGSVAPGIASDGTPTEGAVSCVKSNGLKPTVLVKTKHRQIRLTDNHPVLVQRADGLFTWVLVRDLKWGRYPCGAGLHGASKLVVATRAPVGKVASWADLGVDLSGHHNLAQELVLPDTVEPWFCRLLGFLLGDGHIASSDTTSTIAYSRGVYAEVNDLYDGLLARLGLPVKVADAVTKVHSVRFEDLLRQIGWIDGASNKRVPAWVYGLPEEHREEFLWGFWDADGHETFCKTRREGAKSAFHIEVANESLLVDLKTLIDGLGYKAGLVRPRKERKKPVIKGVQVKTVKPAFILTFGKTKFETPFHAERVISVEDAGDSEVFDLTIDAKHHNFVANGVIVHNCKYGNDYEELLVNADGVRGINYLPPPTVRRLETPKGDLIGFMQDFKGRFDFTNNDFQRTLSAKFDLSVNTDPMNQPVAAFESWEVVHFRLRGKERRSVYGHSALEAARWIWKRLMLLEDAALVYRLQRAPERFAFYVDVGDLPPQEALAFVNRVRQNFRKKRFVDPGTGKLNLKFDALSQDEDFFVPTRKGVDSTRIETLGAPQWQAMDDIEYFRDKLFSAIKVPKAYLGQESGVARAVLSSEDVRFARTVLRIQRELKNGLRKVARVHLSALGLDPYAVDYDINMTVPSAIFELAQMEVRTAKADLAARMRDFVSLQWILSNVFGLSEDEIVTIKKQRSGESAEDAENQATAQNIMTPPPPPMEAPPGEAPPEEGPYGPPAEARQPNRVVKALSSSRDAARRRGIPTHSGFSDRELTEGYNPKDTKRMDAKLDTILKSDRGLELRLREIGGLLRDLNARGAR
jgi:hypothetical protein